MMQYRNVVFIFYVLYVLLVVVCFSLAITDISQSLFTTSQFLIGIACLTIFFLHQLTFVQSYYIFQAISCHYFQLYNPLVTLILIKRSLYPAVQSVSGPDTYSVVIISSCAISYMLCYLISYLCSVIYNATSNNSL